MRRVFGVVPQVVVVVGLLFAVVLPAGASAAPKALLKTVGGGTAGHGGVFNGARGIAVNHSTGDFYVADGASNRIQQFSADGTFIRAWGFDVDSSNPGTDFEVCTVANRCKAGVTGAAAGQLAQPFGVAVDQTNGYLYVTNVNNRRVDVFSGSGQFAGAFGWDVDPAGVTGFEICTPSTGCKVAGAAGTDAGRFSNITSSFPAVDPSAAPGTIYVPDQGNARVSKFATTISGGTLQSASFIKAFGWDVAPGAVNEEQEVRVRATAGQFTLTYGPDTTSNLAYNATVGDVATALNALPSINTSGGAVTVTGGPGDATGSNLYVVQFTGGPLAGTDVTQLTATNGTTPLSGGNPSSSVSVQTRANGGTSTGLESCTTASGCKTGTNGPGAGQFFGVVPPTTVGQAGSPRAAAVDSTGAVYVTSGPFNAPGNACSATVPCRVQKFNSSTTSAVDFGPVSGDGQLTFMTGTVGTVASPDVTVDPANDHVYVNQRTAATSYRVGEYTPAGNLVETHPPGPLTSATATTNQGLAVGTDDRVYTGATGTSVYILGPVPDPIPVMVSVSGVGSSTATFNGTVEILAPGSPTFTTKYHFEYSKNGVDWTSIPAQDENVQDGTTGVHSVTQIAKGLDPNTVYSVRLAASTGNEDVISSSLTFTTDVVAPQVAMSYVDEVTKTQARLGAHIDPEGLPTTYHFEWGTEPCSDVPNPCTEVPAFERGVGDGNKPVIVNDPIDGLEQASRYHYRVVATNGEDTTYGPDQTFETLNHCNLTDNRCYEMVSPPDKGPAGAVGQWAVAGFELTFQAAPIAPSIAYMVAYGLPDATAGTEVLYRSDRGQGGWSASQLSPPAGRVADGAADGGVNSQAMVLSQNLGCGVFLSRRRLTDDASSVALDVGGQILYSRNSVGRFSPIPSSDPIIPISLENFPSYAVSVSEDTDGSCDRVIFATLYNYPDAPGPGTHKLYMWENGVLSNIGEIPGPEGPETVAASPGAAATPGDRSRNFWRAVSDDASRIFFSARRLTSPLASEIGHVGVFVRKEEGSTGVDVSLSQTDTPNDGPSRYETASRDGKYVFFTARSGLADNGDNGGPASCDVDGARDSPNGPGCDLYRYSVDDGALIDLSVSDGVANPGGAGVAGAIGASDDGSHVYFVARGQLVAGEGPSEAENLAEDTYSVYLSAPGEASPGERLAFVGTVSEAEVKSVLVILAGSTRQVSPPTTSQVTWNGRRMLFESSANIPGSVADERLHAYLYDADTDATVCVSCRRDGLPPAGPADPRALGEPVPLTAGSDASNPLSPPRSLTADGSRVFFQSYDRLAVGATEGQRNLYQWEDGQVSFLANSAPAATAHRDLQFAGASASGDDVYFTTVDKYTWQDVDANLDLYDARVGGGFAEPPAPEVPCDPLAVGCVGQGAGEAGSSVDTDRPGEAGVVSGPRATLSLARLSRAQRARLVAGRRVGVAVRVSRPGTVSLRGSARIGGFRVTVISASQKASAAGVVMLPVQLSQPARRRIARTGRLRVALVVRFTGARKDAASTLTFVKPRRAKGRGRQAGRSGVRTATTDRRQGQ